MSRIRKVFFWLHLVAGVIAGLVILVMSVTGLLLAYERQLSDWANAHLRAIPAADAVRMPLGTLLAKVAASEGETAPTSATWRSDATAPVAVSFGRERTIYINAYTGAILGEGAKGWRDFFRITTGVHRWLALEGERRDTGKAITGACNLAFLFLVLSGIYLWWPRQWRWPQVKAVVALDGRLRGKARDWNWHNVLGFWCSLPLVVIVASGVVMSYPWANNLLYRLTGSELPPVRAAGGDANRAREDGSPRGEGGKPTADFNGLSRLAARAELHRPGWQTISWRPPASFMIEQSHRGRPDRRVMLYLDAKTGEVASEETFVSQSLGRRLRLWMRWLHTGEAGGFPGQTLAGLASAATVVLVWTGIAMSLRRFVAWRRKGVNGPAAKMEESAITPQTAEHPAPLA